MGSCGVSTQVFGAQRLTEAHFELLREAGFSHVELFASPGHFAWEDPVEVARVALWVRRTGLAVCSLHAPWAPGQDIASLDEAVRRRSLDSAHRALDALLALGGRVLVLHPGAAVQAPEMSREQLAIARESIATLAASCSQAGVKIALENPPPYELGGRNADMLLLYEALRDEPTVQACFDTGHAHLSREGVGFLAALPKEILVVHLSDNAGESDDHLPPGEGTICWRDFFAMLRECGFHGQLVIELTEQPDARSSLRRCSLWLQEALAGCLW